MRDAAGNLFPVAWVLVPDAIFPPWPTAFGSWLYNPMGKLADVEVGEQVTDELVWSPFKSVPDRVKPGCFVGDSDWFLGDWPDGTPPAVMNADGFAENCGGPCMDCLKSVGLAAAGEFVVTGSPVTSRGTISLDWADVPAGYVLSGPVSGPDAKPSFKPFSGGASAPLTLQPPLDSDFGVMLKQHSGTQSGNLLEVADSSGTLFGTTITGDGQLTNAGPIGTTGTNNERFGKDALKYLSSGNYNTALGKASLYHNDTGNYNTGLGAGAMRYMYSGGLNVAVGYSSLYSDNNGSNQVAVGSSALVNMSAGVNNVGVGGRVMHDVNSSTECTAVGYQALNSASLATFNSGFGSRCGSLITGSKNTVIGAYADDNGGGHSYSTALGVSATITGSHQVMLGTSAETVKVPGNLEVDGTATIPGVAAGNGTRITSTVPNSDTVVLAIANTKGMIFVVFALDTGSAGLFTKADITDMTGTLWTGTGTIGAGGTAVYYSNAVWSQFGLADKGPIAAFTLYLRAPSGTEGYDLRYTWVGPG